MKSKHIPFSSSPIAETEMPPSGLIGGSPGQCLREVYDLVVASFVEAFWADVPELSMRHRIDLGRFIHGSFPRNRFVARHRSRLRRHPEVDPIPRAFDDVVEGSSRAIDIYVRRFVEKDFTAPLIDASSDFDEATHIAWIQEELSALDYRQITGASFSFAPEDRVFSFCSPVYAWERGFGRSGLMVIRDRRIVDSVLVEAS